MTYKEARRLLHPDTTGEALEEIEYYGGLNGKVAKIHAIEDACLLACEALDKVIEREESAYTLFCQVTDEVIEE